VSKMSLAGSVVDRIEAPGSPISADVGQALAKVDLGVIPADDLLGIGDNPPAASDLVDEVILARNEPGFLPNADCFGQGKRLIIELFVARKPKTEGVPGPLPIGADLKIESPFLCIT